MLQVYRLDLYRVEPETRNIIGNRSDVLKLENVLEGIHRTTTNDFIYLQYSHNGQI